MNAKDLRRMLGIVVRGVEDILRHKELDSNVIRIDSDWSDIDDVREHLEFLREQIAGLSESIHDRDSE